MEVVRLALISVGQGNFSTLLKPTYAEANQRCFEGVTDRRQKFRAMTVSRWDGLRDGFKLVRAIVILTIVKPAGTGEDQDHILVFDYNEEHGLVQQKPRQDPVFRYRCMNGCEGFVPPHTSMEVGSLRDCLSMGHIEADLVHEHDCPACLHYEGRSCYKIKCAEDHINPAPAGTHVEEMAERWAIQTGGGEPCFVDWNQCPTCTAESIESAAVADQIAQDAISELEKKQDELEEEVERRR
jgi:hypothetical protein